MLNTSFTSAELSEYYDLYNVNSTPAGLNITQLELLLTDCLKRISEQIPALVKQYVEKFHLNAAVYENAGTSVNLVKHIAELDKKSVAHDIFADMDKDKNNYISRKEFDFFHTAINKHFMLEFMKLLQEELIKPRLAQLTKIK
jgi:hypothetical protein